MEHLRCPITVSFSAAIPAEFPGPQASFYLINRVFLPDRSSPSRVCFVPLTAPVRSRRKTLDLELLAVGSGVRL